MRVRLLRLLLVGSTLLLYAQTLRFDFVDIDDGAYVTDVAAVSRGLSWAGVRWAFTDRQGVAWQPVTWLSHMLDFELYGDEPAGHHLSSALLHALNVLLLFELLRRMTSAAVPAALVAALFAWHPLRVESVAWVAERKDVLSAAFALASLHAWIGWTRSGGRRRYAASVLWLALGLLSKPTVVTLPCIMLLLDHWPLQRWNHLVQTCRLVVEKLPHLALAALSCVVTLVFQRTAMTQGAGLSLAERLANAILAYAAYLEKAVWPADLAVHTAHPYIVGSGASPPAVAWVVLCAAGLMLATALAVRPAAPRYLRVGWLWFLGALVPVIGLVQVGSQALADRYTYLPMIGLALVVGWGGWEAQRRWRTRLVPALGVVACSALVVTSFVQMRTWRDSIALFERAHAVEPNNTVVNVNLGKAYGDVGRGADAIPHFEAALAVAPDWAVAHYDYASVLGALGRWADAEHHYRRALEAAPGNVKALGNLAGALQMQGRTRQAIEIYRRVLERRPGDAIALLNLARLELAEGHPESALALYRRHLARRPDDAVAWTRMAGALLASDDLDGAIEAYERAVGLAPDSADAHVGLGNALGRRGEIERAVVHLRRALALRPDHAQARANLDLALGMLEPSHAGAPQTAHP